MHESNGHADFSYFVAYLHITHPTIDALHSIQSRDITGFLEGQLNLSSMKSD